MSEKSREAYEPVELMRARTPFEADVIVGVLLDAGVPAFRQAGMLADEYALSQQLMNTLGVRVYVPAQLLEKAREALAASEDAARLLEENPETDAGGDEPDEED